ncbi:MAG: hypothetical protein ACSLFQ_02240 [Thermoanaerobaculia bacterium]
MKSAFLAALVTLFLLGCSTADQVEFHHPLDGTPDNPSTVRAIVRGLDLNFGTLRVQVSTVNGAKRPVSETVWIDENTMFTNSGGGKDLRSWEEITGAEVVIKGWYRGDEYFADEIDVISFPPRSPALPRR